MKRAVLLLCLATSDPASAFGQQLAVDHLWLRVSPGASEAKALSDAGFQFVRFDPANAIVPVASSDPRVVQHTGQGTASMIVRFRNLYLELIWVENAELLRRVAPENGYTLLNTAASPLGIGLRHVGEDAASLPFASSSHWAPWMPPNAALATARRDSASPSAPAIFVIPRYLRYDLRTQANPALLESAKHRLPIHEVTRVLVRGPGLPSSWQALRALASQGLVKFAPSNEHLLELEFDGRRKSTLDLRPTLPLICHY